MPYVKLTVPQHIYEKLGLQPSQTLVLRRSKNISGLDTQENVSTTESAETSSHCNVPVLTAFEINDRTEENGSFLQAQDGPSQAIHKNPSYARNRDVKIHYPRPCENCNKKYFTSSSYFGHRKRCRLRPGIQKASYPDSSSVLNVIPEAFHAVGYDAPVLAEPEINDTPERNESSQIIASGIDAERYLDSSDNFNMIPEALHALGYDTPVLAEPEINDATDENESSLQKHDGTSRAFLNPSNIDSDAGKIRSQNIKAKYPRPCPLCEMMCNSSYMYYKHSKKCRPIHGMPSLPKKKAVVRYYNNDCNSDSSDDSYMTPVELRALGYDTPVLAESEINKSNEGRANQSSSESCNAFQGMNTNARNTSNCRRKKVYPRECENCFRSYASRRSFSHHKVRCSRFVAKRSEEISCQGIKDATVGKDTTGQRALVVFDPPEPGINKMIEGEASNTGNKKEKISCRRICLNCCRSYATKFAFKRHLKSCDYFKKIGPSKRAGSEEHARPKSAPKKRERNLRQDKVMDAPAKEEKRVNWIPVTTNPTKVLKYFVTNRNSS